MTEELMPQSPKRSLSPDPNVHKVLISSPVIFKGSYKGNNLLIEQAVPSRANASSKSLNYVNQFAVGNVVSRYYYVCSFDFMPERKSQIIVPDFSHIGDDLCIALSIFYGKRFDNHGLLEGSGHFWVPSYEPISINPCFFYPTENHDLRVDSPLTHSLDDCSPIIEFILSIPSETPDADNFNKLWHLFYNAGKFYWNSIKSVQQDIERAYLDLITCGEIISNYYDFSEAEKISHDSRLVNLLSRLEKQGVLESDISEIKGRLFQVKRKFSLMLERLLDDAFFARTENKDRNYRFTKNALSKEGFSFEQCMRAAYDLRSKYVHSGFSFSQWIEPLNGSSHVMNEILPAGFASDVQDPELRKTLQRIPSYTGLERVMRYALLRLLNTNGFHMHPNLKG